MRPISRRLALWTLASLLLLVGLGPVLQKTRSRAGLATTSETVSGTAPPDAGRQASERDVIAVWVERIRTAGLADFPVLARRLLALPDAALREVILSELLQAWLRTDAADFNKYFMALEVQGALEALNHLADALKLALPNLDDATAASDAVKDLLRRLVAHLARHDPTEALAWAREWLLGDSLDYALLQISRSLAQQSPQEALNAVAEIHSPLRRMQAAAAVGGVWARSDARAALQWAAELGLPTERALALNSVLMSMAQSDANAAAGALSSNERALAAEYREAYRRDLAALGLTQADVANARENYLELLESGSLPRPTSPDVELLADAARLIARRLAQADADAGLAWAEALETELLKLHGVKGAVNGWSTIEPAAAAAFVAQNYSAYPQLLTDLFDAWSTRDPAVAAAAARELHEPQLRAAALEAVMNRWALEDPTEAAAWLDQLPRSQRADAMNLALVHGLTVSQPAEAWARAQQIANPSLQYQALKAAFSALVTQDPSTARSLLESTALSSRNLDRLRAMLPSSEGG